MTPFPKYKKPQIEIIEDLSVLYNIKTDSAFDYETTGLKPHAAGHKIICASIADTNDHVYVFMMPKTRNEQKPFLDFLTNESIRKYAHNMKFENTWSKVRLRVEVKGWKWDSMIAAHILDNRTGITSLKFQSYIQFGIIDYESSVSSYLEADKKNSNSINRIEELIAKPGGKELLLEYCAYDSINERRLATQQMDLILPLPF